MRSKNISRFLLTAEYYDWTMNLLDAIGLGAFTVVGVNTSISAGQGNFQFLTIFLGVITGVGGGLLRDMMACEVPAILRKHVYACASIAGSGFLRIHRQPHLSGYGTDSQCIPGSRNPSARQTLQVESPKMQYESFKLTIQ